MEYQINGIDGAFEEGKLALTVLQDYCSKNECTFNELKEIFPDEVQGDKDYIKQKIGGNTGVFDTLAEAKDREDYFALLDPITIKDATIVVSTCWGERNLPLFIELEHQQLITHLELTKMYPYVLLYFKQGDDKLKFKGAAFNCNKSEMQFSITTQYKKILLVPFPIQFKLEDVSHITLNN